MHSIIPRQYILRSKRLRKDIVFPLNPNKPNPTTLMNLVQCPEGHNWPIASNMAIINNNVIMQRWELLNVRFRIGDIWTPLCKLMHFVQLDGIRKPKIEAVSFGFFESEAFNDKMMHEIGVLINIHETRKIGDRNAIINWTDIDYLPVFGFTVPDVIAETIDAHESGKPWTLKGEAEQWP